MSDNSISIMNNEVSDNSCESQKKLKVRVTKKVTISSLAADNVSNESPNQPLRSPWDLIQTNSVDHSPSKYNVNSIFRGTPKQITLPSWSV